MQKNEYNRRLQHLCVGDNRRARRPKETTLPENDRVSVLASGGGCERR